MRTWTQAARTSAAPKQDQIGQHIGGEVPAAPRPAPAGPGPRHPQAALGGPGLKEHLALQDQQGLTAGPGEPMAVQGAVGQGVPGQVQHRVPQGAGAQQGGAVLVLNLPVEPAQGGLKARVGQG